MRISALPLARASSRAKTIPNACNRAVAFYNRGYAYSTKRDRERAIADYDEALRLDPDYDHAYANRGLAYFAKGDFDRAIADYNRAIRDQFQLLRRFYNARRQRVPLPRGEFDRAIADYDEARSGSTPSSGFAYFNRGGAYRAKSDYENAIADYDAAIRLNPKDAVAYNNRGVAKLYGGALPAALGDFEKAGDPGASARLSGAMARHCQRTEWSSKPAAPDGRADRR